MFCRIILVFEGVGWCGRASYNKYEYLKGDILLEGKSQLKGRRIFHGIKNYAPVLEEAREDLIT